MSPYGVDMTTPLATPDLRDKARVLRVAVFLGTSACFSLVSSQTFTQIYAIEIIADRWGEALGPLQRFLGAAVPSVVLAATVAAFLYFLFGRWLLTLADDIDPNRGTRQALTGQQDRDYALDDIPVLVPRSWRSTTVGRSL